MNPFKKHKLTDREKRCIHFILLLVIVFDLIVIGHASAADWSFLTLSLMIEVNL